MSSQPAVTVLKDTAGFHDQRVNGILARLDQVEERHGHLEHKVDGLAHSVDSLGTSMSAQFSQVLHSIQQLATTQAASPSKKQQRREAEWTS